MIETSTLNVFHDLWRLSLILEARYGGGPAGIVLCHGVWDVMHPGHLYHLQAAKEWGDVLVVSVTADEYVAKGPGRPIFPQTKRMEQLAALEVVDYVVFVGWTDCRWRN